MLNISKFSRNYSVRYMNDSDADDILGFCLQNTQYYEYCEKKPSRELILNDLHLTPPGTPAESKHYVGFFDRESLAAVMDLVEGYPDDESAFIGFFMMDKSRQGRQIGTGIIQEVCNYLKQTGIRRILLGIDKGNPQSTHFWKKNGFRVIKEVERQEGIILLAERTL